MPPLSPFPVKRGRIAATVSLMALAVSAPWAALAQMAAPAPRAASVSPAGAVGADAFAKCEHAVRQALLPAAKTTTELRFSAAPSVQQSLSNDNQIVLRGEGQWRDAAATRKFTYSCNLDRQSGESVGVVIRQAAAQPTAPAKAQTIQEPDLSQLSPSACESSAAAALKQRWPRVSKISFDSATRSLTQQSSSRAELHGQGHAQSAPESQVLTHFGFACTIDPRDGRVVGMRLSG